MALVAHSWRWELNGDLTLDGHFPLGNKPPGAAVLEWNNSAIQFGLGNAIAQRIVGGAALSHDVRQYLGGTSAAIGLISVVTVSGDDVTAEGFNQPGSGDNLTNAVSQTGSGSFKLGATISGDTVYSDPIAWSNIAATPTDTLAPTAGTGLKGVPIVGGILWSFDPASDVHDGSNPGSGIKEYDLELNGAITVIAGSPGITSAPTLTNIGNISNPGAPSATQTGRNWELKTAGTGIDATSDEFFFVNWPASGSCRVIVKVNAATGTGNEYAPIGVMIRESLNADSKYVACYQWFSVLSRGLQGKYRAVTGGGRTIVGSVAGSNTARWVMVERIWETDTFNFAYSVDGRQWQPLGSGITLPMNANVFIGGFAASMQAGSEIIAQLHDLNASQLSRVTYQQTTASITTARVRARDLKSPTGNVGSYSALSDAITPIVSAGPAIKWHPGHYICTYTRDTLPASQITEVVGMKALAPEVKGVGLWFTWRFIEPLKNSYSGLTTLINAVDDLWEAGLRTYLFIADDTFGGTVRYAPDYLTSEPGGSPGIYNKATGGTTPTIWLEPIMNRVIALFDVLGAAFDGHAGVEVVHYRELDPNFSTDQYAAANYSDAAYYAQLQRWVVAVKAAFPHTNVVAPANFLGSQVFMEQWVEFCYQHGVGLGGPDVFPQSPYVTGSSTKAPTWTDFVLRGSRWNGAAWVSGFFDYRGKILIANQVQDPEMGRTSATNYTPSEFYNYISNSNGLPQGHVLWWRKDYAWANTSASSQTYWSNATLQPDATKRIKPYLSGGGHPLVQDPPDFYNDNVTTD